MAAPELLTDYSPTEPLDSSMPNPLTVSNTNHELGLSGLIAVPVIRENNRVSGLAIGSLIVQFVGSNFYPKEPDRIPRSCCDGHLKDFGGINAPDASARSIAPTFKSALDRGRRVAEDAFAP